MWFLLMLMLADGVRFETVRTLAEPPGQDDLFLADVIFIEIDEQGRYYASDHPSAKVFVWNADGSFKTTFGGLGEGPGEFAFGAALGPPMGYVKVFPEAIYVYSGGRRTVSKLDREFNFVKKVNFQGLGGKINAFHVLEPGRFLLYDSYFCDKKPCRRLLVYNERGDLIQTLRTMPDKTWSADEHTGRVSLYLWSAIPVVDFNRARGEVVVADSSKPQLEIWSPQGKHLRTLNLDIPKKSVTDEDIAEHNDQEWVKGNAGIKLVFPDQKDYFDQVISLKKGYLVYHQSPLYGIAEGYLVDDGGKVEGRFRAVCGEGGGLYASRGRLVQAKVDEAGDFELREVRVVLP